MISEGVAGSLRLQVREISERKNLSLAQKFGQMTTLEILQRKIENVPKIHRAQTDFIRLVSSKLMLRGGFRPPGRPLDRFLWNNKISTKSAS